MSANTATDEPIIVDSVKRDDEVTVEQPADGEKVVTKTAKPADTAADAKAEAAQVIDAEAPDENSTKQYDEKYVKDLRAEAAKARVDGKEKVAKAIEATRAEVEKELTEKWGRSLGLIKDDDAPADPAKLLEQATEREKQAIAERDKTAKKLRDYDIKDAITNAANTHDGDLTILLPVLRGEGKLDDLDPTADDFASQVDALVSAAVDSNPKLRKTAQVAATRSSGDLSNGGNGSPKPNEPKSIDEMRKDAAKRLRRE